MAHNEYTYSVWEWNFDQFSIRATLGFRGGNRSTDGKLVCGDHGDTLEPVGCADTPRPSYLTEGQFPNWPYLTNQEAGELTEIEASEQGASDGWCAPGSGS